MAIAAMMFFAADSYSQEPEVEVKIGSWASFMKPKVHGAPALPLDDRAYRTVLRLVSRGELPLLKLGNRPLALTAELEMALNEASPVEPGLLKYIPRWMSGKNLLSSERGWHLYSYQLADGSYFDFDPRFSVRFDNGDGRTIMRRGSGIQFRGRFKELFGYSFRFEDRTERGGGPYTSRSQLLEDHYGYVGPFRGGDEVYYDATEAYLNWANNWIDLTFGKDHIAWGPGRGTNLLFSGNSPSFTQFRARLQLTSSTQFTYLLGQLQPSTDILSDSLYRTGQGWTRYTLEPKWVVAHRLEYAVTKNCVIAINEAVIWGERGLDPSYLNPLGFFYSAQHDGGDRDNILMAGDFVYRFASSRLFYGEVLIDDLKTSQIGKGDVGNRIGWLCGVYSSDLGLGTLEGGIEYTRLEPFVYSHFFPINRFSTWNSSLGADIHPNSDQWEGTLGFRPLSNLNIQAEANLNQHGSVGGEIGEAIPPNSSEPVYFLDEIRERWWGWGVEAEWEPLPGGVLSLGTIRGAKQSAIADRWYISVGYRI